MSDTNRTKRKPAAPITGQAYVRHQGAAPDGSGRRLVTLLCVLAVPKEFEREWKDGHQYVMIGPLGERLGMLQGTEIDIDNFIDNHPDAIHTGRKPYYGMRFDQLSCAPIWRV